MIDNLHAGWWEYKIPYSIYIGVNVSWHIFSLDIFLQNFQDDSMLALKNVLS